jgi:hypothetical protein
MGIVVDHLIEIAIGLGGIGLAGQHWCGLGSPGERNGVGLGNMHRNCAVDLGREAAGRGGRHGLADLLQQRIEAIRAPARREACPRDRRAHRAFEGLAVATAAARLIFSRAVDLLLTGERHRPGTGACQGGGCRCHSD